MGRPSEYVHIPWLDNLLTAIVLIFNGLILWYLKSDHFALAEFVGSFLGTIILIRVSKEVFKRLCLVLGTQKAIEKPRNVRKFADQGWQFTIHVGMSIWEWYILEEEDWKTWENAGLAFNGEEPTELVRSLYVFQLGVWMYTAVSHRFFEARHKDYYVMYVHHVATIVLVFGSYYSGFMRIGLLVLFCHDFSDITVDLLKMTNYLGRDSSAGLPIVEFIFASNLVVWVVYRMYHFPMKTIRATIYHEESSGACQDRHLQDEPWRIPLEGDPVCNYLRLLLIVLQVLHVWWFFLFCRIAYRLLIQDNAHDIGKDEYEGASSDSAVEYDTKKKHE